MYIQLLGEVHVVLPPIQNVVGIYKQITILLSNIDSIILIIAYCLSNGSDN
jgi:hypothetical protein